MAPIVRRRGRARGTAQLGGDLCATRAGIGSRGAWSVGVVFMTLVSFRLVVASNARANGMARASNRNQNLGHQCWETASSFERDCFHAEPLGLTPYPLTAEMFARSVPYETPDHSFHRAFRRAREREVLKVVVLGGSVTFGHECSSPAGLIEKACAWPHRVEQWFQQQVTGFDVEVKNEAVPASGIFQFLHLGMDEVLPADLEVDLIIVDFGVNDAVVEQVNFKLEYVKMAHDTLIRYVLDEMSHSPALLYTESFISPIRATQHPWQGGNMAEVHASVTQKYGIPMASFRHAVWPDIKQNSLATRIWGRKVHPDWRVQQLMADLVVFYIQRSHARFLKVYGTVSSNSPSDIEHQHFQEGLGCLAYPRSYAVQLGSYERGPPPVQLVTAIGWSFSKVAGKSGLIGFGKSSSNPAVATFLLPCSGERRVLDVEYLVSYEGMGAARVVVDARPEAGEASATGNNSTSAVIVDGLWGSHASVSLFETIPLPDTGSTTSEGMIRVTFKILSAQEEISYASSRRLYKSGRHLRGDRKFKLISLQCC
ncbi:unnamed protein product [Ectocarpus sp. 12 AP-2014]